MPLTGLMTEALLLGVSSGPVCLASCSPILVPVLAAEQKSPRGTGALLAQFLGGRLAGYLGFACLAWLLGLSLRFQPRAPGIDLRPCRPGPCHLSGRVRPGHARAPGGLLRPAVPRRPGAPLRATVQEFRICYSRICERSHIVPAVRRRRGPRRGKRRVWPMPCSSFFGSSSAHPSGSRPRWGWACCAASPPSAWWRASRCFCWPAITDTSP